MYMENGGSKEVVLVRYYYVVFFLIFRVGVDEYKKNFFVNRINSGEKMMMKDIYGWCQEHQISLMMKFVYRKDFSVSANLWNLYSFCRFRVEAYLGF